MAAMAECKIIVKVGTKLIFLVATGLFKSSLEDIHFVHYAEFNTISAAQKHLRKLHECPKALFYKTCRAIGKQ